MLRDQSRHGRIKLICVLLHQGWHTTRLAYASMALPILCNIYARRIIAPLEIVSAILHVLLLIVFVVSHSICKVLIAGDACASSAVTCGPRYLGISAD